MIPDRYWTGKPLLKARLPWLTPGAIQALETIVQPHFDVLELGAGGSTLFFSDRCRSVYSWEPDPNWSAAIRTRLHRKNVVFFDQLKSLVEHKPKFDLVLVDNNDQYGNRRTIVLMVLNVVCPGGWLVLDNYGRYRLTLNGHWTCAFYNDTHWSGRGTLLAKLDNPK